MSIGMLTSANSYSSLKNTGAPVTDRFTATTTDQEVVEFKNKDNEGVNINTMTVEADADDLYFSVWIKPKTKKPTNGIDTFDWTDEPVFFCPAGETVNISGLGIGGIRFENTTGARYFIQGMSW